MPTVQENEKKGAPLGSKLKPALRKKLQGEFT
jgi:hypothetical protein